MTHTTPPTDRPIAFLRYLHARRFSDREIAEYLNDPPSYLLHRHMRVESPLFQLDQPEPDRRWTPRMVRRWRDKLGLAGHRRARRELRHPGTARVIARRAYAARWVTLGLDLTRAQVDILDALVDRPHTMRELMARYGWRSAPTLHRTRSAIAPLVEAGVVLLLGMVTEQGRVVRQYGLSPEAQPLHNLRRLTGVERRLRELGLMDDCGGSLPHPTTSPPTSDYCDSFDGN